MKSEIKQAFDSIHASEALKAQTKAFLAQRARRRPPFRRIGMVACTLLLLVLLGSVTLYFSPVAVISIDVNPSVELSVNRFDRIVEIKGLNEDGEKLAQNVQIRFLDYTQAVEQLLNSEEMQSYLGDDAILSIGVIGKNTERCDDIMVQLKTCTSTFNPYCYIANNEELEQAHSLKLSCGKYRAFLALQQVNPSITPEEVSTMTMKEIQNLLEESGLQQMQSGYHHGDGKRFHH
ncbi:hypothetical protein [uncultured Ruthenibacterium sp.]|uniref:anti-sigma-I factor RsgI family protein n=1 Tax=uncultured Ruthenibacterium sp. TaxID=1905347 RepID=UPI00349EC5AD